jgi:hypothetical protein
MKFVHNFKIPLFSCIGGYPIKAYAFMQEEGIVSGGNYTHPSGCLTYPFPVTNTNENSINWLLLAMRARQRRRERQLPYLLWSLFQAKNLHKCVPQRIQA